MSQSSMNDLRTGFSSTMDLNKPQAIISKPGKEVGVITLDELEGLRLRATGMDYKTLAAMDRTKTKTELYEKSRNRISTWNDTAEKYL